MKYRIINENDNVMVALVNLQQGEVINNITILEPIRKGHKIALKDFLPNSKVIKYGYPIGYATEFIKAGNLVHTHNLKTGLSDIVTFPKYEDIKVNPPYKMIKDMPMVKMYQRSNNEFGIRNELWVIPTVGCIGKFCERLVDKFKSRHNELLIDGIHTFNHAYGCSQMGDDHETTKKSLQNIVLHPNAGGVLVVGLGCENNQLSSFKATLKNYDCNRIRFLNLQDVTDEEEQALAILEELYNQMKDDKRVKTPISNLRVGLKCGGSDAFSGITGNPLIGRFSDYLVSHGGTTVLTEVPEMFGGELKLLSQAKDQEVYEKIVKMINDFKNYFISQNQVIYENPSPGNKEGGITTLEEKSLGCCEKAGQMSVVDVLALTSRIRKNGLNLLSGPGNDLVSTTALGMAGCQLVLFSTGRGTPFGGFIPTIKIATNHELALNKPRWIDFDASGGVEGLSEDEIFKNFIQYILNVVQGQYTYNEKNNYREIAIFKTGVTL